MLKLFESISVELLSIDRFCFIIVFIYQKKNICPDYISVIKVLSVRVELNLN